MKVDTLKQETWHIYDLCRLPTSKEFFANLAQFSIQ